METRFHVSGSARCCSSAWRVRRTELCAAASAIPLRRFRLRPGAWHGRRLSCHARQACGDRRERERAAQQHHFGGVAILLTKRLKAAGEMPIQHNQLSCGG